MFKSWADSAQAVRGFLLRGLGVGVASFEALNAISGIGGGGGGSGGGGGRTMLFPAFSKTAVEIFFLWGRGGHLHLLSHPPPPPPLRRHPAIE